MIIEIKNGKILLMSKVSQKGQSLVEVLVGLGIISIMVGASTYALVSVLRSSTVTEQNQSAGLIGNGLLEYVSTLAEANWNSLYNLQKTSANHYFLVRSSTTTPTVVAGDESVLEQDIINGLIGYWKFDETAGNWAYDSSGNGNLGTLYNSPTRTASANCKAGPCLSFNGTNNYIRVPSSSSLDQTGDFTLSAWVYVRTITSTAVVLERGVYGSSDEYGLVFSGSPSNGVSFQANNTYYYSNQAFPLNQWVHLTGVLSGTTGTTYINGGSVATGTLAKATSGTDILNIGYRPGSGYYFDGLIDDVRIYSRALSATEITQLYNSSVYSRYFYVDNVNRKACGTGDISTDATTSCGGSANDIGEDPSTQKITVGTSWSLKGINEVLQNYIYVTRWTNSITEQSDWGGSAGVEGAVSELGNNYSAYSGISTTTSGSIKVEGI